MFYIEIIDEKKTKINLDWNRTGLDEYNKINKKAKQNNKINKKANKATTK